MLNICYPLYITIDFIACLLEIQKQPSRVALKKRCSENMQQIYRRTSISKCDFNKVAKQLYWNQTSAWVLSCKFAAYFQNIFFWEYLRVAASGDRFQRLFFNWTSAHCFKSSMHKKRSFTLRIYSVNVTKTAGNCGFGYLYGRNHEWKASFLCSAYIFGDF